MCRFWAREKWRDRRRVVGSYLDVDTTKDQFCLLNPTPLGCIAGYITENAVGNRALKRLTQISLNLIDGSISCYCSIINPPIFLEQIRKTNKLAYVLCDLESDRMRES